MPRKKSTKSLAKLKKELDSWFSKYIRLKYADHTGNVKCYTCGKTLHWKQAHCGHFVPRHYLATRWDENNCRVQEVGCNVFGNGQILEFEEKLIKEIGQKKVDEIKKKRHQITKLDRNWYEEKISHYKNEVKKLSTD